MTQVGYVRAAVDGPTLDEQTATLRQAGAETIVVDQNNDIAVAQQELQRILARMQAGDVLLVWRLDRLGRSVQEVLYIVEQILQKGLSLRSFQDNINTSTSVGQAQSQVFIALAQCSRRLGTDRTQGGLRAARARGVIGGRRRSLSPELVQKAAEMMRDKDEHTTVNEICRELGISKPTLYRYVGPNGVIRTP